MIYHPRTPQEAVNLRKEHADTAVYLAGGTDDLRLGGAAEGKDLIDITGFEFNTITEKDGKVYIGALCTLQDVIESELVPAFIREAAGFCASFTKRNSATVGGNLGLRRSDSYLAAALTAADAVLKSITPHGEQDKPVGEYLQSDCKRLIEYVVVDKDRTGSVKRFGNTSSSHATLIAAESGGIYALSVQGSCLVYGTTPDIAEQVTYRRQPRPAPLRQLSCRRADCGGRGAQIHHAARRAGQARRRIPAKRLQASDRVCRGR